jgi:ATP-dependent DNA helicase RecG
MNDEEIIQVLLEIPSETTTIEFKRLVGEKVVSKIVQTIVAMSNTDGGIIVLGVDDPEKTKLVGLDRIYGIEEDLDNFDAIGREIQNILPPYTDIFPSRIVKIDSIKKSIAIIHVPKNEDSFKEIHKSVYVRGNKSNKELRPQEIIALNYSKGFKQADKELVNVSFDLLETNLYKQYISHRNIPDAGISNVLFDIGLARKDLDGNLLPTLAAVMLFANHPTHHIENKCAIRVYQYTGTLEKFEEVPNLISVPKTIEGPVTQIIKEAQDYVLQLLQSGIRVNSGFLNKFLIPERVVKESIVNAVIHRDYYTKRDIEISIFEDRIQIDSPGLFVGNITKQNIGLVRSDRYRNDLLVKHLREFPERPNLDRNEGVRAMRHEMKSNNLYPPIFLTYPSIPDSVRVVLFNEIIMSEWEKLESHLRENNFITNKTAREVTGIEQLDIMSKKLKKWTSQGLLIKINHESMSPKLVRYKLPDARIDTLLD